MAGPWAALDLVRDGQKSAPRARIFFACTGTFHPDFRALWCDVPAASSPLLSPHFKSVHFAGSPVPQGIAPFTSNEAAPVSLHDPPSSCYHVARFNSHSPSFAFNSTCGALRDAHRIEHFFDKKACRSNRKARSAVAVITGLFRTRPFSGARGTPCPASHASAPLPRPRRCNDQQQLKPVQFRDMRGARAFVFLFSP